MDQEAVYRQAVRAAKKKAPGLSGAPGRLPGGFTIMEDVYKEQHKHQDIRKKAEKITA